ncbi:cyclase family protein [Paracoccaceae bacterium]|nr:cyclase family protein [Paracoccaceae bacterium]
MPRKFIDLSVALETGIISDPPMALPEIEYVDHATSADQICSFFPGLDKKDLPGEEGWAVENLKISTHNGTHLDAPYHYHSTMDGGKRAITIDEVPLDWCFSDGIKLDFRHFEDGYVVTPNDIDAELTRIGYKIKPFDIVLVNTSAGERYGYDDYLLKGCGMGREATLYLTSKGVKITGTDAWSWDAPFSHTAKRYAESKDSSIIWEGHRAGMERAYCHIEKLGSLEKLPDFGFLVSCFPYKIKKASAGFIRAVAILEE